jgi:hypothetical protein
LTAFAVFTANFWGVSAAGESYQQRLQKSTGFLLAAINQYDQQSSSK